MPNVSVIVPCYNKQETLERAVRSALAQAFCCEVIIVDDCSTDRSLSLAKELEPTDTRIRVLRTERNVGPGGARNLGAAQALGSHLCFLDADDELLGNFFDDALSLLARSSGMRVVKGDMEFFDPIKGYLLPLRDVRYPSVALSSACGMVMERAAFMAMGGFSEDPAFRGPLGGEDVAFMEMLAEYWQPIGRLNSVCYRVWSEAGSHVDKFLANTRIRGDGFDFICLHPDQQPDGVLAKALRTYRDDVGRRIADVR